MERRQLLAADIHFGGVYFEEATGDDSAGDRFEITFAGGEPGTQLTRVVIDTDKDGLGLSSGDLFFDIQAGGLGAFNSVGLVIQPTVGFTVTGVTVSDGGTLLAFDLTGFDAGERLVFTIDVDEAQFVDPDAGVVDVNSLVEGGEFQRSKLTATFAAPHFFTAVGTALFFDAYDDHFADLEAATGTQLLLPPDNYIPPDVTDRTDRTAGAAATLVQQPLPITIAGTVYHDVNLNNAQDAGELGLTNVTLELLRLEGNQYVATGLSALTDAGGNYRFEGLAPGTYAVAETQPAGYFSVGATAGHVGGATRGVVSGADLIRDVALLGGEDSVDNDFAEAQEAELHGNVYIDANNNGVFDTGEIGIAGATVLVEYLPPGGGSAPAIEVLTDAQGRWWATGLRPGDYRVAEITPPGFLDGLDSAGSAGGTAHNPGDLITGIFLAGGQVGVDYNFGELLPSSIQGRVHADADGDCVFDPGETPLAGVVIRLLDALGNVIDTTTTDVDGNYRFDGLVPGTYGVFEVQPSGYFDGDEHVGSAGGVVSANDTITAITLGPGIHAVNYDFCEHEPVSISGFVYVDLNNNGVFDSGETALAGVELALTDADGLATGQTTTTDVNGFYLFDGLAPGVYGVRETQPAGFIDGLDSAGSAGGSAVNPGDLILGAVLNPGVHGVNYNFGELLPSSIQGRVHADANGDCIFDPGETPLAGVVIRLLDSSGNVIDTTTTDAAGNYRFDGLAPGTYGVFEVQPSGYFDGDEHVGSAGGVISANDTISAITLGPGIDAVNYDFCEHEPVSISGFVYVDLNNNGLLDAGETPLSGVQLELTDGSGNGTGLGATTDANGFYLFDGLAPGVYGVRETQPAGFIDGLDSAGSAGGSAVNPGDLILGAVLNAGVHGVNYNFGELLPSSIQGRVHADANGDCIFDPGETPLAGVVIRLLDSAGIVIDTTTTDADGNYRFDGLSPGTYGVFEVQPSGYFDGDEHVGSAGGVVSANDTITAITLGPGIHAVNYDFCEHEPVSISGFVYVDLNNNGLLDAGETPLSGVQLELTDGSGNGTGQTTATDANGFYRFDGLAPGVYGLSETQPAGFIDGLDSAGSAGGSAVNPGDLILGAMLNPGVHGVNYNFGELLPSSIQGRVHADANGDCIFDPGETPLAGIVIHLLDEAGNIIDTTTTDADGNYRFDGLAPGTYGVVEIQPSGYFDGDEHVGTAGGVVSANDTITDITLGPGVHSVDYDFCEHEPVSISGFVYADDNNNGVRDFGEAPIAGVTLTLLDSTGAATTRTALTDAAGFYVFDGLAPGEYGVAESQPVGFFDGLDSAGSAGGTAINPGDAILGALLSPGVHGVNYNFGELRPASIAGRIHADANGDCLVDPGEQLLSGVTVQLLDADGNFLQSTTTDVEGNYRFEGLAPGTYRVREIQPEGFFDGDERVGTAGGRLGGDDLIVDIMLGSGVEAVDYDFCEIAPATLSGYVFQDGPVILVPAEDMESLDISALRDGRRTPDDMPLAGIELRLADQFGISILDAQGMPITTLTDAQGFYQFTGLRAGIYSVFESQPTGWMDGIDSAGTAGGLAINPTAEPLAFALAVPHNNDAIIGIRLTAGVHSLENNFSEVVVESFAPPPPIPPPPVPPPVPPIFPVFPPEFVAPPFSAPAAILFAPLESSPNLQAAIAPRLRPALDRFVTRVNGYTWHLSIIDAGQPRAHGDGLMNAARLTRTHYDIHAWNDPRTNLHASRWLLAGESSAPAREVYFGMRGATPVTGDFNGDGITELAVFINGQWYIDLNGNGIWDDEDLWARLGSGHDLPVAGDWDGDGKTDIGIFGPAWGGDPGAVAAEPGLPDPHNALTGAPKNLPPRPSQAAQGWRTLKRTATGRLRADLIDHVFHFGTAGEHPVAGDFNGDGVDQIGVFRNGQWVLDADGDGAPSKADIRTTFGREGDLPIVGDFNGDGMDQIGVFRGGTWLVDANGNWILDESDATFHMGRAGDLPVTGDFDGDGRDEAGVYQRAASSEAQRL